jgi:ACT domain-containing protein
MLDETRAKLERVKELLKQGYSLRKAIRGAGLGCKSYYKYEGTCWRMKASLNPRKYPWLMSEGLIELRSSLWTC